MFGFGKNRRKEIDNRLKEGYESLSKDEKALYADVFEKAHQIVNDATVSVALSRNILPIAEELVFSKIQDMSVGEKVAALEKELNRITQRVNEYAKVYEVLKAADTASETFGVNYSLSEFYVFASDDEMVLYNDSINQINSEAEDGRFEDFAVYCFTSDGKNFQFPTLNRYLASRETFGGVYEMGHGIRNITELRDALTGCDKVKELTVEGDTFLQKMDNFRKQYLEMENDYIMNLREQIERASEKVMPLSLDMVIKMAEKENESRTDNNKIQTVDDTLYVVYNVNEAKNAWLFLDFYENGLLKGLYFKQGKESAERVYNTKTYMAGITVPEGKEQPFNALMSDSFVKDMMSVQGLVVKDKASLEQYFEAKALEPYFYPYNPHCEQVALSDMLSQKHTIQTCLESEKNRDMIVFYNQYNNSIVLTSDFISKEKNAQGKLCKYVAVMCGDRAMPTNDVYLRFEKTTLLSPANWVKNNADTAKVFGRIKETLSKDYPETYKMFSELEVFELNKNNKMIER